MSAALVWVFVGCAVLAVPGHRAAGGHHAWAGHAAPRSSGGGRGAPALAVFGLGAGCVAALGIPAGPLAAALACPAAWAMLTWLRARPVRPPPDPALPLALDLVAAALRGGRPLAEALALGAPAARPDVCAILLRIGGLLRLGAEPKVAWSAAARDGPLAPVVPVAVRSADSGTKIAAAFERLAADLRAEHCAACAARAHRAGVMAMAPLAACFLPSFVCLGVVPVVVGIARNALNILP